MSLVKLENRFDLLAYKIMNHLLTTMNISKGKLSLEEGFDLVSSNKLANTSGFQFYQNTRSKLKQFNKQYLYETNVGAGLPLIDTIKLLHDSGENITRIRGVFSGSLSYLFNTFSSE